RIGGPVPDIWPLNPSTRCILPDDSLAATAATPGRSWTLAVLLALLAPACSHTEPFGTYPSEVGLPPWSPNRMTYSGGDDVLMGHSFNGDEVFYTYNEDSKLPPAPPQGDRCLGSLPAVGGSRQLSLCGSPLGDADSAKVFHAGTRLADGSLVIAYSTRRLPSVTVPLNGALYIQRPGDHRWTTLIEYPYAVTSVIPSRILSAGPDKVITIGAGGTELITISTDNSVTRKPVGVLSGVDAGGGYGLRHADGMIRRVNLESGAESDLLVLPAEGLWS